MTGLIHTGVPRVAARVNWGRWVVDCPRCPDAAVMDPGAPMFLCKCGAPAEVVWPPEETVYGIERLLLMRPDPSTRNWVPEETLVDLMVENGAHGIFSAPNLPGELTVGDEAIRRDSLPLTRQRTLRAVAA